jgi:hypothetical protein
MGVKPHPRFIETGIVALLARKKVRHSSLEFAQQLRDLISHRSFLQRRRLVFRLKSRGQKLFRKATFHVDLGALNGELIAVRRLRSRSRPLDLKERLDGDGRVGKVRVRLTSE